MTLTHILPAVQLSGTVKVTEFEGGASQLSAQLLDAFDYSIRAD